MARCMAAWRVVVLRWPPIPFTRTPPTCLLCSHLGRTWEWRDWRLAAAGRARQSPTEQRQHRRAMGCGTTSASARDKHDGGAATRGLTLPPYCDLPSRATAAAAAPRRPGHPSRRASRSACSRMLGKNTTCAHSDATTASPPIASSACDERQRARGQTRCHVVVPRQDDHSPLHNTLERNGRVPPLPRATTTSARALGTRREARGEPRGRWGEGGASLPMASQARRTVAARIVDRRPPPTNGERERTRRRGERWSRRTSTDTHQPTENENENENANEDAAVAAYTSHLITPGAWSVTRTCHLNQDLASEQLESNNFVTRAPWSVAHLENNSKVTT